MTEAPQTSANIPQWTLGDRLRKAREHARLSQAQLAHEIGIGRTSLTHYETEKKLIPRTALLAWAFRTRVPPEWLRDGTTGPTDTGPGTFPQFGGDGRNRSLRPHKRMRFALISPSPLTSGVAA